MKILVATADTQGARENDFNYCAEGELVVPLDFCQDCVAAGVDSDCGCLRGMAGAKSRKATTTFKVAELPINIRTYAWELRQAMSTTEWAGSFSQADLKTLVKTLARDLSLFASLYPVGTVFEKRPDFLVRYDPTREEESNEQG